MNSSLKKNMLLGFFLLAALLVLNCQISHASASDWGSLSSDEESQPRPKKVRIHGPSKPRPKQIVKDDSDDERDAPIEPASSCPEALVTMGTRLKLLTNVYLGKMDETANIFLPRFTATFEGGANPHGLFPHP